MKAEIEVVARSGLYRNVFREEDSLGQSSRLAGMAAR